MKVFLLLLLTAFFIPAHSQSDLDPTDIAGLRNFYNTCGGPEWGRKKKWMLSDSDACLWEGVYCSNVNTTTGFSNVLGLTMSTNHLTCVAGTSLPVNGFPSLVSFVAEGSLLEGNFDGLTLAFPRASTVDVGGCRLTGTLPAVAPSPVPQGATLILRANPLIGTIPEWVSDVLAADLHEILTFTQPCPRPSWVAAITDDYCDAPTPAPLTPVPVTPVPLPPLTPVPDTPEPPPATPAPPVVTPTPETPTPNTPAPATPSPKTPAPTTTPLTPTPPLTPVPPPSPPSSWWPPSTAVIIGVSVGAAVLVVAIVVATYVVCRTRQGHDSSYGQPGETSGGMLNHTKDDYHYLATGATTNNSGSVPSSEKLLRSAIE